MGEGLSPYALLLTPDGFLRTLRLAPSFANVTIIPRNKFLGNLPNKISLTYLLTLVKLGAIFKSRAETGILGFSRLL